MLATRIATAVVLLAILIPSLFFAPHWVWQVVSLVALSLAAYEWGRMLQRASVDGTARESDFPWHVVLCIALLSAGLATIIYPQLLDSRLSHALIALAAIFWLILSPLMLIKGIKVRLGSSLGHRMLSAILAFLLLYAAWLCAVQLQKIGPWYLLSCLLIVWLADTGAYFAGRAFGKSKLAPSISPGKTRAGAWGGLAVVVIFMLLGGQFWTFPANFPSRLIQSQGLVWTIVAAIILTAYSIIGDLLESKLKREVGMKDSGKSLPGHGGMLDRLDAVLAVLPLCWLIHSLFIKL